MHVKAKRIILNLFSVVALFFNYQLFYKKGLLAIFNEKYLILKLFLGGVLFVLLFLIAKKSSKSKNNILLASLFATFLFIGSSYRTFGTIIILFYPKMLIFSAIKWVGYYNILVIILNYLQSLSSIKLEHVKDNKFTLLFDRHPLLISFFIIACAWSIYYVAFYPIVLSPDPSYQIKQALGERTKYSDYSIQLDPNVNITNHHPVVHTLMLGGFIRLGRLIINDNFGLFLYSLTQGIIMALTFAYTIKYLKQKGIGMRYLFIILALYSLVPMFPFYALNANKDVYYTIFMIWLLIFIFDLIESKTQLSYKKCFFLLINLLLICLFRNNGIYLIVFLLPFLVFYNKLNAKRLIIVFGSCILLFFGYKNYLLPTLKITETSPRERMSIFFQQTARYVIKHEDDLTAKDQEVIGKIIDYQNIKKSYNPALADPIKNTYNKYATSDDLKNYFIVWGKGLIKHPITYLDATLNNTYGYFDVGDKSWYIYYKYYDLITENNLVDYHYNNLAFLRNGLFMWAHIFLAIPIIGLVSSIGFNSWIVIAYLFYLIKEHRQKYIALLIPLLVSMLICIASPANTYFRYAMPYVFSTPFVVGTWLIVKKKKN